MNDDLLRARIVNLPHGRSLSFGELLDGWMLRVQRIHQELDADPSIDRDTWGVHDYIGALNNRDLLDQAMAELSEDERSIARRLIASSDDMLQSLSARDPSDRILQIFGEPRDAWWWHVIPRSGPILAESIEIIARRQRS